MNAPYFVSPIFEKFQCLAEKCPENCCSGWQIRLDTETETRYQTCDDPMLKAELIAAIEEKEKSFKTVEGQCPFFNDKGRCRIQELKGHDWLPKICREYPRAYASSSKGTIAFLDAGCPDAAVSIFFGETSILPPSLRAVHPAWEWIFADCSETDRLHGITESLGLKHYPHPDIFEDIAKLVRRPLAMEMNKSPFGREIIVAAAPMFFTNIIEPDWPPDEGQNLFEYALEQYNEFSAENPRCIRRMWQQAAMQCGFMLTEGIYQQFGILYAHVLLFRLFIMGQILIEEPLKLSDFLRFACQFERRIESTQILKRVAQNITVNLD